MTLAHRTGFVLAGFLSLALLGCDAAENDKFMNVHASVPLTDQEDEVCGMLVREQSAPRGQVVHRDGSRFFFCSLGDMLVHLGAPSPHGRPEAVFVEVMKPEEDPMQAHTGEHPWLSAEDAVYVVGIERQLIMGKPVLAYASKEHAERVMLGQSGSRMLDMDGLRQWWAAGTR